MFMSNTLKSSSSNSSNQLDMLALLEISPTECLATAASDDSHFADSGGLTELVLDLSSDIKSPKQSKRVFCVATL